MKKKILIGIGIVVAILVSIPLLWFLLHEHEWQEATCTECKVCISCGKTEGEPLGHKWKGANCENPKTCLQCNVTQGEALGHKWKEATCTTKKICYACNKEEGVELGHDWGADVLCTSTPECKRCGEVKPYENHTWNDYNCVVAKACTKCSYESEEYGLHSTAHGVTKQACPLCGEQMYDVKLNSSNWKNYFNLKIDQYGSWATIRITPKYKQCHIYSNSKVKLKVTQRWYGDAYGGKWYTKTKTLEFDLKDYEVYKNLQGSDYISDSNMTVTTSSASGEMLYFTDRLYVNK